MTIEVSVVTPTYNRRMFIPTLIEIYKNQTFPKEKMEWIIIDDGRDKVEDLFKEVSQNVPNVRYIQVDEKMRIGAKRNMLNKKARAPIIIAMDDDDYYPPDRVQIVVDLFQKNPKVDLIGSSEMYLYYTDNKKVYSLGPFHNNHSTNATMAWRKRYSDIHNYDEFVVKAEEVSFLENYKNKMIQVNPKKAILVICHSDNTVDKTELRNNNSMLKETIFKLEDFVKEPLILDFYRKLSA